jgi:uncharacterized protein YbbC (DUF1343 family)
MMKTLITFKFLLLFLLYSSCIPAQEPASNVLNASQKGIQLRESENIRCGANQTEKYFHLLRGKKIALVANHSSLIGKVHLADSLLASGIDVSHIYAPEHGFRGEEEAGAQIKDGKDVKTGLKLYSLHGEHKKPIAESLQGIELIVFDIQDVGARFYTYISTLHYVMEACAEQNIPLLVLDRPNPNGFYVDGPVLEKEYTSFVGMHPVPVVHGMSIAEYANMVNGEGWLAGGKKCSLQWVTCEGWDHQTLYTCPVPPSPNLATRESIYLYPSLCFFEGTIVSVGRGTATPFQVIGYPGHPVGAYRFTPQSTSASLTPMYEGRECRGHNLKDFGAFYFTSSGELYLEWLTGMYEVAPNKSTFFSSANFFDKLAGSSKLREQIIAGWTAEKIRESWQPKLREYRLIRKKYVLYPDFD